MRGRTAAVHPTGVVVVEDFVVPSPLRAAAATTAALLPTTTVAAVPTSAAAAAAALGRHQRRLVFALGPQPQLPLHGANVVAHPLLSLVLLRSGVVAGARPREWQIRR